MEALTDARLTLVGLLFESTTALRAHLDRQLERDADLPLQWFELLLRLARSPGRRLRMSDLAAQTGLTPSGLTRAVDRLETAGLVERAPCASDKRGSYAALTAQGLDRVVAALGPHLTHVEAHLTGVLTDDEQAHLTSLLRKVRDHVNPAAAAAIPVGPVG
ncbi:MAG: winged helix-turn-helix transcriptional regulator [Acidimicrobiales bacterium]|nr:winged helix-turn-helix transcriptional regulator [Acidimicrobiales bacterium]